MSTSTRREVGNLRIIGINVGASLARFALGVVISLYSSRLLLAYLGEDGFGILTALGASGAFLLFFSLALVRGLQREIAFQIGLGDTQAAATIFSSAALLFAGLGILFLGIMVLMRSSVIDVMSFPLRSRKVVEGVYIVAMSQVALTILFAPFRAVLEATQQLAVLSLIEISMSVLNLCLILLLPSLPGDRLLMAGLAQGTIAFVSGACIVGTSCRLCRQVIFCSWKMRWVSLRGVFGITGWSIFGHLNWILRNEGSVFALNVFYGPGINASYSLALRLNALQNELAFAVVRAIQPALTASVAQQDSARERMLTLLGSKLPALASLFLWVPFLFCAEDFLQFWLGRVPEGAGFFVRALGIGMLGIISYGHQMALESRGRLAGVTLWMTLPQAIGFLSWCVLQHDFQTPFWTLVASQVAIGLCLVLFLRPWLHGAILGIAPKIWFTGALAPVLLTHAIGAAAAWPAWYLLAPGLLRLVGVAASSSAAMLMIIWLKALTADDRAKLRELGRKVRARTIKTKVTTTF